MRVLDLDLDFFQEDVAHFVSDYDGRLESDNTKPWNRDKVIQYLENNLGLNKNNKIKGRIVEHHDEAFYFWRDLILEYKLKVPFEVVHIDAHADLGFGDLSWRFIMTEYLYLEDGEKLYPERLDISSFEKISYGNYLAYAIACKWINKLTYVIHPRWGQDLPSILFKNRDVNSGTIQLKKFKRGEKIDICFLDRYIPISYENEVEFIGKLRDDYKNEQVFDFLVLSISPGYTVKEADYIIDIIREYVQMI